MKAESMKRAITFLMEYHHVAPEEKKAEILEIVNEMVAERNAATRKEN